MYYEVNIILVSILLRMLQRVINHLNTDEVWSKLGPHIVEQFLIGKLKWRSSPT